MIDLIAEYEKHLRRLDRSPNTIHCYVRTLRQADRELPEGLDLATTEELEEWLFSTSPAKRGGGGRGKSTRAHYARILRGFGKWATDPKRPRLDFDATAELPDLKPAKGKPKPAREDLLAEMRKRIPAPFLAWILLGAFGGLRCCEISRLNREDVTAERIWLRGKGDKERYVPCHPLIWEAVRDLPRGPIAVGADGKRLTDTQVSHRGNYRIRKANIQGVSMHKLRHRFATRAHDATRDLVAVQELLGHSDVSVTRRYVEVNRDRMAAAVASLPVAV
jgi:integrase/recombinase XerC